MKPPIIVLNFKTYAQSRGEGTIELVGICEKISNKYNLTVIPCVPLLDLKMCAYLSDIPIFSQHLDPIEEGAHTGSITVDDLKYTEAVGTLLNHSEKRIPMESIKKSIELAKKNNIITICCVENLDEAKQVLEWGPDMIAYEDKELIGSGKSIADFQPDNVKKFAELIGDKSIPLAGAGVSNEKDVIKTLELGMKGVLMASAFVKAKDPKEVLEKIAKAVESFK